jgi:hypothetical protein
MNSLELSKFNKENIPNAKVGLPENNPALIPKMTTAEFSVETEKFNKKKETSIKKINEIRAKLGLPETNESSAEIIEAKRKLEHKAKESGISDTSFENPDKKENEKLLEVGDEIFHEGIIYKVYGFDTKSSIEEPSRGTADQINAGKGKTGEYRIDFDANLVPIPGSERVQRDKDLISQEWKDELKTPHREFTAIAMNGPDKGRTRRFTEDTVTKLTEENKQNIKNIMSSSPLSF